MKKILLAVAGVVLLLVVVVLIVPLLIPTAAYEQELLDRISAATGRPARIDGRFGFTILPQLSLSANKVTLANEPGATPADMLAIDKMSLRVALIPLLSGHLVVRSLVLDKPVIDLAIDKSGRPNWRFAQSAAPPPTVGAHSAAAGGAAAFTELILHNVSIVDGEMTLTDARTGARQEADQINLNLTLPSHDEPIAAAGSLTWHKERAALALHVADAAALLAGKPVATDASITAELLHLAFKGTLAAGEPVAANGTLSVTAPSVSRLVAWADGQPGPASGAADGGLELHGAATLAGADVTLQHTDFSLGAIKGAGDLQIDDRGIRPDVTATLTLGKLDLDPYLPAPRAPPASAAAATRTAPRAPAPPHGDAVPFDLTPLTRFDGHLDLTLAGLIADKWVAGPSHVSISLKDGQLTSDLDRSALYGGGAKATMTVDATAVPRMTLSCQLAAVQLKPLLAAAADTERLEGTANLDLNITGDGNSRPQILASLSGSGRLDVRDGALRGIDLEKLVNGASVVLNNPAAAPLRAVGDASETTAFSQLSGSYTIRQGVLSNNDLSLRGSRLTATGQGSVNLVARTLDYRLDVKLQSPSTIRIAGASLSELTVPVVVSGPWDAPSYRPDLTAAARGLVKGKVLRELGQKLPGVSGVLQQLFGH
jgi:AsmA protein